MAQGDQQNMSTPSFARGMAGPFGKFTGGDVKTDLDQVTYDAWLRLCASKSVTSAELLRDLIYLVIHGRTPAEIAADDRRQLLTHQGRIGGPIADHIGTGA
jgi:hypothetical protein